MAVSEILMRDMIAYYRVNAMMHGAGGLRMAAQRQCIRDLRRFRARQGDRDLRRSQDGKQNSLEKSHAALARNRTRSPLHFF